MPAFMVMPSYVGVRLPVGTHQVRMEYTPSPLRAPLIALGAAIFLVTAQLSGGMALGELRAVLGRRRA